MRATSCTVKNLGLLSFSILFIPPPGTAFRLDTAIQAMTIYLMLSQFKWQICAVKSIICQNCKGYAETKDRRPMGSANPRTQGQQRQVDRGRHPAEATAR